MGFYPEEQVLGAPVPWLVMLKQVSGTGVITVYALVVLWTLDRDEYRAHPCGDRPGLGQPRGDWQKGTYAETDCSGDGWTALVGGGALSDRHHYVGSQGIRGDGLRVPSSLRATSAHGWGGPTLEILSLRESVRIEGPQVDFRLTGVHELCYRNTGGGC